MWSHTSLYRHGHRRVVYGKESVWPYPSPCDFCSVLFQFPGYLKPSLLKYHQLLQLVCNCQPIFRGITRLPASPRLERGFSALLNPLAWWQPFMLWWGAHHSPPVSCPPQLPALGAMQKLSPGSVSPTLQETLLCPCCLPTQYWYLRLSLPCWPSWGPLSCRKALGKRVVAF